MRISVCDDDGVLLDEMVVSVSEWLDEVRRHPHGLLAQLQPGDLTLVDKCVHVKTSEDEGLHWCLECGYWDVTPGVAGTGRRL